ncbi:endonuclease/exonuclease/phosphatase family protein [Agromyces sp. CFH 90414]|uniref:Endonuclease/exonuclease/phosphatase family protein n=1 Tax=Agromyces agglutinans TaxID=2662258 RepID=A0A6I2F8U3_9MICO|nr:endonuclease/exonuclease/phosphatase family protein [Agromyces agglutinans]MRG60197.1 endonuclease/exonuclease/phosphatase family protein [Agromyces agglutinans]
MLVISYNLRKHRAIAELAELDERYSPDVICVQECETSGLAEDVGRLRLAHSTTGNRLGLAIYYRPDRLLPRSIRAFALKKSLHDRLLRPAHERLLGARLIDLEHQRDVIVASFHAAPLTALNSLRRHQIRSALGELQLLGPGLPTLMVGDYNYPIFKDNLAEKVREAGYELTLSDARTYTRYKFFRGHFDLATSAGLEIRRVETLPRGSSDHLPILVHAEYADRPVAEDIDVVI